MNSKEVQHVGHVPHRAQSRNVYKILVIKQLGKQKNDDVNVDIKAAGCKDAICMKQAQNHVKSSALV